MYRIIVTVFVCVLATAATAQDRPTQGLVSNTSEMSSLNYSCRGSASLDADLIECTFEQTSVRKKAQQSELTERLAKARSGFQPNSISVAECKTFDDILQNLRNQAPADIHPKQREFAVKYMTQFVAFCRNQTVDNLLAVERLAFEKDLRSCKATVSNFTQRFKRITGSNIWTANEGPSGPCGVIVIARLERADSKPTTLYNYVTKKVVSNKTAEMFPGLACTAVDEAEYKYQWQTKEWVADCEFMEFGY